MKIIIYAIVIGCLLYQPSLAFASCTTTTVHKPDGTIVYCTTCCFGGRSCMTTCV